MIYEIVCNLTGERYIGSTLNPVDKRIKEHIWDRNNKEKILNKSKTYYENNKDRIKAYQKDYKKNKK